MTTACATVTNRGQVTLPRAVREAIGNAKVLEFIVQGNTITLHSIPDMTGVGYEYAKGRPDIPFSEVRKQARQKAVRAKVEALESDNGQAS